MIKFKFGGVLAKKFGKEIELEVTNTFQFIGAMNSIHGPDFKRIIQAGEWTICDGAKAAKNSLQHTELERPFRSKVVHLMPAVRGSNGNGGLWMSVIGIALFAAGAYTGNFQLAAAGVAMYAGGVSQLMVRIPRQNAVEAEKESASAVFTQAENVTTAGGPVPIIYGVVEFASSVVVATDFSNDYTI